jgi:hypothetical protein
VVVEVVVEIVAATAMLVMLVNISVVDVDEKHGVAPPDRQHASPEAGSSASLPLLVIGHSCICRHKGGLDAETEELVHGDSRPGAAGSALCNPVVARQCLDCAARGERAPPSPASAWSGPAAGIDEQEGVRSDGEGRSTPDAVGDPHPQKTFTAASGCTA